MQEGPSEGILLNYLLALAGCVWRVIEKPLIVLFPLFSCHIRWRNGPFRWCSWEKVKTSLACIVAPLQNIYMPEVVLNE